MRQGVSVLTLILLTIIMGMALGWLGRTVVDARRVTTPPTVGAVAQRPTALPTIAPTAAPTAVPTSAPTAVPTSAPTALPTVLPTIAPTATQIALPTVAPTALPTVVPIQTPLAPAVPAPAQPSGENVIGYIGHTVGTGETLASIAAEAGSSVAAISRYNLLAGEPEVGRALIIPQLASVATIQSKPQLVRRGRSDKPWLALTLDAGAGSEPVASMLQTLRERNIKLTFFLTGTWIRENPELVRQIVADGHEIANHTLNHLDLRRVSSAAIREELAATEELLQATVGQGATTKPFFRPPYGGYDERVLTVAQREGYLPIYWTLDSLDSVGEPKTPQFLLDRVTNTLTPEQLRGAIILAHCGSAATAEALPHILDSFAAMGFEVRKLSEVL